MSKQVVIFSLNEEDFAVDIEQTREIIKPIEVFKVPNTPDFVDGLINLRGKVYTVFNLRKKFNLPPSLDSDKIKIIIVNINSTLVGFLVDEVKEIEKIEDENIENTPDSISHTARKYVSGIVKARNKVIPILDLSQIVASAEAQAS